MQIVSEHHLYLDDKEFKVIQKLFNRPTMSELRDEGWTGDELQMFNELDKALNEPT